MPNDSRPSEYEFGRNRDFQISSFQRTSVRRQYYSRSPALTQRRRASFHNKYIFSFTAIADRNFHWQFTSAANMPVGIIKVTWNLYIHFIFPVSNLVLFQSSGGWFWSPIHSPLCRAIRDLIYTVCKNAVVVSLSSASHIVWITALRKSHFNLRDNTSLRAIHKLFWPPCQYQK